MRPYQDNNLAIIGPGNDLSTVWCHGLLSDTVKLRVAHAPGTFSPPPRISNPDMHHGMCIMNVRWCMLGLPTSSFLWHRWRGKRSHHSRRMRNRQFYVSGKRPMSMAKPMMTVNWAFSLRTNFCEISVKIQLFSVNTGWNFPLQNPSHFLGTLLCQLIIKWVTNLVLVELVYHVYT